MLRLRLHDSCWSAALRRRVVDVRSAEDSDAQRWCQASRGHVTSAVVGLTSSPRCDRSVSVPRDTCRRSQTKNRLANGRSAENKRRAARLGSVHPTRTS